MGNLARTGAAIFAELIQRRLRLLVLVSGMMVLFTIYSEGLTWASAGWCALVLAALALFSALSWFWLHFFRSLIDPQQDRP